MKNIIETQNFYLRSFNEDDFDMFYEWAQTGEAIAINTKDDLRDRLSRFIASYNDLGFTKFAVFHKETKVFDGLDLQIAKGQKVGIVGHSGAKKSTPTSLLLNFRKI